MLHTIKKVLINYPPASFPRSLSYSNLGRETSALRFCTHPDTDITHKMDKCHKTPNPSDQEATHGDVMSHSFGEGYATRSDEEGFGGIYGGNQSPPLPRQRRIRSSSMKITQIMTRRREVR